MIQFDPNRHFSWRNSLAWGLFKGLSFFYGALQSVWSGMYRTGVRKSRKSRVPVISVGNITVGGTGKTPMIGWLLALCAEKRIRTSVLTRGYKANNDGELIILNQEQTHQGGASICGDEPWLLSQQHPESIIYVSANRVESAKVAEKDSQLLLLDDGSQHHQLARDLDILLIDAVAGLGNHGLLPYGPLREPLKSLKRADIIVYTKTNLQDSRKIRELVSPYLAPQTREFDSQYIPRQLISSKDGGKISCSEVENTRCLLFSGVGNPQGFERVVKTIGGNIVDHLILEDHQVFDEKSLKILRDFIRSAPYDWIICTEKDWVKLKGKKMELPEFYYLSMDVVNEEKLENYLLDFLKTHQLLGDKDKNGDQR